MDEAESMQREQVRIAVQQKRVVIALQNQEAQEELARLQSSIEFMEQSVKVQSNQRIVVSKTNKLDCMSAAVSRAKKLQT